MLSKKRWQDKISNTSQVGGIETSVLDNGSGKGTRIAWVNTGSGLRYKILIDRALDMSHAFFNAHSLAWISHPGTTYANPATIYEKEWLRSFGGGLLTTCGLSHVGGPESDEHGIRGIHGRMSNLPSDITAIKQPDHFKQDHEMSITGVIKESSVFGPNLELKRTISSSLFENSIKIKDEVRNCGNTPVPHMLLYHFNFGWPLIDEGTKIIWDGNWQSRGNEKDNRVFNKKNDFRTCPTPIQDHQDAGEAVCFIEPVAMIDETVCCGVYNPLLDLAVSIKFKKNQLPYLTNWQHWGLREYVTALEPGTNPPIGQKKARETNTLDFIEPGDTRNYDIDLEILNDIERIQRHFDKIV
jgi:hypothetical protein